MPEIRIKRKITIKTKHPYPADAPRGKKSRLWLICLLSIPIIAGIAYIYTPKAGNVDDRIAQKQPPRPVPPPIDIDEITDAPVPVIEDVEIIETPEENSIPTQQPAPEGTPNADHHANTEAHTWGRQSNLPKIDTDSKRSADEPATAIDNQKTATPRRSFMDDPQYQTITPENLCGFISEWKAYSKLLVSNTNSELSALASDNDEARRILARQYSLPEPSGFVVMTKSIPVEYKVDNRTIYITPNLPKNGVYLTPEIKSRLENFINGASTPGEKQYNIEILSQFINVRADNTGYNFLSFPAVTHISVTDDAVVLRYRPTSAQECELTYERVGDKLVPDTQLRNIRP